MKIIKVVLGLFLGAGLIAYVEGCSTSQTNDAFKVEGATDITVRAAMTGWGLYVSAKHPGTNAEMQVSHAFDSVKAAELTVIDATASLASNPTNAAPLTAAQQALTAASGSLTTLITSLTNSIH